MILYDFTYKSLYKCLNVYGAQQKSFQLIKTEEYQIFV